MISMPNSAGRTTSRAPARMASNRSGARQQAAAPVLLGGQQRQAVLDDDDGAVDDDAEIDGAEAHQIGADLVFDHAGHGEQHRQRNDAGGGDGRADVAEKQEQDHDDQQRAFEQVLLDGRDGRFDEVRAVVDGARDDPFRQRARDVLELGGDALRHRAAVLADQQHGRAEHGFFAVERCGAGAQLLALAHLGHVAGRAPARRRASR